MYKADDDGDDDLLWSTTQLSLAYLDSELRNVLVSLSLISIIYADNIHNIYMNSN